MQADVNVHADLFLYYPKYRLLVTCVKQYWVLKIQRYHSSGKFSTNIFGSSVAQRKLNAQNIFINK